MRHKRRLFKNIFMLTLIVLSALLAVLPLLLVFVYLVQMGWAGLDLDFFTELPKPVGEIGGGMSNAIVGSTILVGLASLIGVPLGVACGIFLSEYGQGRWTAKWLRLTTDVLTSVPSIVVGLFAYVIFVVPFKGFSAYAGAFALAIIIFPVVARTTEEILKLIPDHIREAGLALGLPRWRVIIFIVLKGSLGGVFTGIILSVARVAGETAPLLFTAFSNRFGFRGLSQPIASLPVQIYTYASSPFPDWHRQAWTGALVLVTIVFLLNIFTRYLIWRKR